MQSTIKVKFSNPHPRRRVILNMGLGPCRTATLAILLWMAGFSPCFGAGQKAGADEAAGLFSRDRLLEVQIELAPSDWDQLRAEHHDLVAALGPSRLEKPPPDPYHIYPATAIINGERLESVGLRKRGFLGSASTVRPSLGIRFDAYDKERRYKGLKRMSLNNNLQDPSQMRQVLAYGLFAKAGLPAPRCSLAKVTVNGQFLGIYTHVEAVDEVFLRRQFGSSKGNLYEGRLSDFRPGWVKTFERKNHKDEPDTSDLNAVVDALALPAAQMLEVLPRLVDVEEYRSFWAVECLIGHWDSYSNGGNNFFVYFPPNSGRMVFIPWGADGVLGIPDPFKEGPVPVSVMAGTQLPHRLYQIPRERAAYRLRLREVLETVWNEDELLAEMERLDKLVRPYLHVPPTRFQASKAQLRAFIHARRAAVESELNGPAPREGLELRKSPCLHPAGRVTADFQAQWREAFDIRSTGPAFVTMTTAQGVSRAMSRAAVHRSDDGRFPEGAVVWFLGGNLWEARVRGGAIMIPAEHFAAGNIPLDGTHALGIFMDAQFLQGRGRRGGLLVGNMHLESAGTTPGALVKGRVEAELYVMDKP